VFERYALDTRLLVGHAQDEAAGCGRLGTEHLLLGLLADERTVGTRALLRLGVDLPRLRAELRQGRPAPADTLAVLGVDLDAVRRTVEEAFGPGALERAGHLDRHRSARPRLTGEARKAMKRARVEARRLLDDQVGSEHVLIALAREADGPITRGLLGYALHRAELNSSTVRSAIMDVRSGRFGDGPPSAAVPARPRGPHPSGSGAATA